MTEAGDEGSVSRQFRLLELTVGPVAHGGHCVARSEGQVVFVRHALPGERVRALVTEGGPGDRFLRADAVEVLAASPDRVPAPCPLAHADGCGGCDFQHVALPAQRELKAQVVREQLQRLAGLDREVVVEAVPGDLDGLRWRTRMQYVALADGRRGLRKHRSHEVVEVADCLIAHPDAREQLLEPGARHHGGSSGVVHETVPAPTPDPSTGTPESSGAVPDPWRAVPEPVEGPPSRPTTLAERAFDVDEHGFWQVHPGAPTALAEAVLTMAAAQPGERVLDLYAGVGLFSAYLGLAVGPEGRVEAVETDRRAVAHARENLADLPWVTVTRERVDEALRTRRSGRFGRADVVVLDPPRTGAKRRVVEHVVSLRPRAVVYVACDPAALARDVATFAEHGFELSTLRAFDLFPMTHHVECVALLEAVGFPG